MYSTPHATDRTSRHDQSILDPSNRESPILFFSNDWVINVEIRMIFQNIKPRNAGLSFRAPLDGIHAAKFVRTLPKV